MRFRVVVKAIELNPEFIDEVMARGAAGLNEKVLPHLLEVAKARSPKSQPTKHNPNRANPEPVQLAPIGTFDTADEVNKLSDEGILRKLHSIELESGKRGVTRFIRKNAIPSPQTATRRTRVTRFFRATSKRYAGAGAPKQLQITRGGGLRGTFRDRPGTLQASHKIIPAKREGNKIVGGVAATAPYAIYVHEGFTHKGGWKNKSTSSSTQVKGRKWLRSSLANVKDDLINPSSYQG